MQKWEYLELVFESISDTGEEIEIRTVFSNGNKIGGKELNFFRCLNDAGKDGWELVSTHLRNRNYNSSNVYYFKRPIE